MTKTKPLQRWRRVEDEMSRAEYVDFTSDILSHSKAVSRNFIFSSSRAVEIIIWHFYVASRTERQPYRIPSVYGKETKKQITIFSDSLYVRDCFIDFFSWKFPRRVTPSQWQSRDNWNSPWGRSGVDYNSNETNMTAETSRHYFRLFCFVLQFRISEHAENFVENWITVAFFPM